MAEQKDLIPATFASARASPRPDGYPIGPRFDDPLLDLKAPHMAPACWPESVPVSAHSVWQAHLESSRYRSLSELILSPAAESQSRVYHSEARGELDSPELPTILSPPCGAWLLILPRLRLSFQMAMRSYFVLREGLSDTSSQVAENHCLFIVGKVRTESVCKTRSCRRNFCNQWGIGEHPNKPRLAKWIARGIACSF